MAYQLPVGPCWPLFVEEETTAAAFTGLSYPGSSKKERRKERKKSPLNKQKTKVTLPWKQPQFESTSRNSLLCLTPACVFFFFSLLYRHTHTQSHTHPHTLSFRLLVREQRGRHWMKTKGKLAGSSFTCLIISGDEGHSQNSLQ